MNKPEAVIGPEAEEPRYARQAGGVALTEMKSVLRGNRLPSLLSVATKAGLARVES